MHELVERLYRQHAQEITTALALSLNNRVEAEDLTHETFLRALDHAAALAAHPDPRAWLFRTAFNLARNWSRRVLRHRHKLAQLYPVLPEAAWDDAIDLRVSLQALSRQQRNAVILHYYLGFSVDETATILGCRDGTVKTHLHRARTALGYTRS